MSKVDTDRNLLFGILAVQLDFVSRDALVEAMNGWVLDKSKPLGEIMREQGKLDSDRLRLLNALVTEHLKLHGGDTEKSLRSLNSSESVREGLTGIVDQDVKLGLTRVVFTASGGDSQATRPSSAGASTSSGTRFRILRPHAKGGLGQVSVALDVELNREVAIKELQDHFADDARCRTRFSMEAEITGGLEHPGVVPVYGLGQLDNGRPYYAMRFIRGESLKEAIERFHGRESDQIVHVNPARALGTDRGTGKNGRWGASGERALELRKLLQRVIDVCEAIEYAHSRGVLHRDLKPGNIMLGKYGETLVVDWGLAKPLQSVRSETIDEATLYPSSGSGVAPTQMGAAIGTPVFMSPEQAAGRHEALGPASDVYSLGATLYCVLTGHAPFAETDVGTTLRKVQNGDFTPPRKIKRDIPAALEAICLRAMAIKPSDRYASPGALASDIEHWLGDEPVQAQMESAWTRGRRWLRRHPALAASSAITALAGVATLAVVSLLVSAQNRDLTIAYAAERDAKNEANVKRLEAEELRERERLAKEAANNHRDAAERLAIESRQRLKRLAIATAENMLDRRDNPSALLWASRAWELDRDDRSSEPAHRVRVGAIVASLPAIEAAVFHSERVIDFVFSPDGNRIATRTDGPNVYVWDYGRSQLAFEPLQHDRVVRCVSFSSDGRWLATASGDSIARIWNATTGELAGELVHPAAATWIVFVPNSNRAATCGSDRRIRFWSLDTFTELDGGWWTDHEAEYLAFNAAGTQLVVSEQGDHATLWNVKERERVGEPMLQTLMTASELDAYYRWPTFSPDGRFLATGAHEGAFVWDTATGREVRSYREGSPPSIRVAHELQFSPDSTSLLITRGNSLSVLLDLDSGEVTGLSHPREAARGCISPDGSRIATQSTGGLIHMWNRSGGELIWNARCGDQATRLAFSRDGQFLAVGSWDGTVRFYRTEQLTGGQTWQMDCGVANRAVMRTQSGIRRFTPDGTIQVETTSSPIADVTRRRTAEFLFQIGDPAGMPIRSAVFSDDGRRLIELSGTEGDQLARVWDVAGQRLVATIGPVRPDRAFTTNWLSTNADASRIAVRDSHGILGVFNPDQGKYVLGPMPNKPLTVGTFHHYHRDLMDQFAISPDGKLVAASTASDGSVAFWDVNSARIIAQQIAHRGWSNSMHFSPDGSKLLLCSSDTTARIISTQTGQQIGPALRHNGFVRHGDWHPDGRRILTMSSKGDLLVWDSATGEVLMRLSRLEVANRAWFSSARNSIICFPAGGKDYVAISIPAIALSLDEARDVAAILTGQSIDDYDGIGFIDPSLFRQNVDRFRQVFQKWRQTTGILWAI